MLTLASIGVFVSVLQNQASDQVLGTYRMLGKDWVAMAPNTPPQPSEDVVFDGQTYRFVGGKLIGCAKNAAQEIKTLYDESKSSFRGDTPVWHVKFFVFTRMDTFTTNELGLPLYRRGSLFNSEVDEVCKGVALFCSMAEAYAGGRVKVEPDLEIDSDMIWVDGENDPFKNYGRLLSRVNHSSFDSEDKVYRGPFESTFFVHPGMYPSTLKGQVHVVSFKQAFQKTRPELFSEELCKGWVTDVRKSAAAGGIPSKEEGLYAGCFCSPQGYLSNGIWKAAISSIGGPPGPEFWPAVATTSPDNWAAVGGEPAKVLKPWPGSAEWRVSSTGDLVLGTKETSSVLSFGHEASAFEGENLVVDVRFASFFASKLPTAKPIGYAEIQGHGLVVFEAKGLNPDWTDAQILGFEGHVAKHAEPAVTGNLVVGKTIDPDFGEVTEVRNLGWTPAGKFKLLEDVDPSKQGLLSIHLKMKTPFPLELSIGSQKISIFGNSTPLMSWRATPTFGDPATGWQDLLLDIRPLKERGDLMLGFEEMSWMQENPDSKNLVFYVRGATLSEFGDLVTQPTINVRPEPSATSENSVARALFALEAKETSEGLRTLLREPNEVVRVAAVMAVERLKDPLAEQALSEAASGTNQRVAEYAIKALSKLGTESSEATIKRLVSGAAVDHARVIATQVLAQRKDKKLLGLFSTMLTSRTAAGRIAGAEAIAAIPGREASIVLMAFLQEVDPMVRLRVTELADASQDLVCRRLLWSSVNDPSEAVRIESYLKLATAAIGSYKVEGQKGIRDESWFVRLSVVQQLPKIEQFRTSFLLALTDSFGPVRAGGLDGLRALAGTPAVEELMPVFKESDPRAQISLVLLAKEKKLILPVECLKILKASPDPNVARLASDME